MAKTVDVRIDGKKVEKLLPNILGMDLVDRERYDYRLGKLKKDRPVEYFQKHMQLVEVLADFKNAADNNFIMQKRKR